MAIAGYEEWAYTRRNRMIPRGEFPKRFVPGTVGSQVQKV